MEIKTTEAIFVFRNDNILELSPNKDFNGTPTMEGAIENVQVMQKFCNQNIAPKGFLVYVSPQYMKKEIIKYYGKHPMDVVGYALVSDSFATNFVISVILKLTERLDQNKVPTKMFKTREEATNWLYEHMQTINNNRT